MIDLLELVGNQFSHNLDIYLCSYFFREISLNAKFCLFIFFKKGNPYSSLLAKVISIWDSLDILCILSVFAVNNECKSLERHFIYYEFRLSVLNLMFTLNVLWTLKCTKLWFIHKEYTILHIDVNTNVHFYGFTW